VIAGHEFDFQHHTHNHFTAFWILSGTTRVSQYQKHSPTHTIVVISHSLSASSICYDLYHPPCSIYVPDSLFVQSLSKFSLVNLLAWHHFILHTFLHLIIVFFSQHMPIPSPRVFFFRSYGPGLTSVQHTTSHTTAVQCPSHFQ